MQTLTFTQKLLRQRRFLSPLIPLFALFVGLGFSQKALGQAYYNFDNLTISASTSSAPASSTTYDGTFDPNALPPYNPFFDGADLGNGGIFDQATGASTLLLTAAEANVGTSSGTSTTGSNLEYRVYPSSATTFPAFSPLVLNQVSAGNSGPSIEYSVSGASIDLLHQTTVLGGGTYTVEVRFATSYNKISRGVTTTGVQYDPSGANGFRATFRVVAPAFTPNGGTTNWISTGHAATDPGPFPAYGVGSGSTDWRNAGNWDNGVPTATSNAVIPERTSTGYNVYPILDDISYPYAVKNLTLLGQANSTRAQVTIENATLTAYGNIRQNAGGLRGTVTLAPGVRNALQNSTLVLAGGDQIITGLLSVPDVIVAGSGTKSVTGRLNPSNTLSFRPTTGTGVPPGVIVQSASEDQNSLGVVVPIFDTTLQTLVDLGGTGIINQEPGYQETTTSYVKGVLRADRSVTSGVQQIFGNIGLDVTTNFTYNGTAISIFRIVGDPLQSPTGGTGSVPVPIKRQYLIDNALDSENPSFSGSTISVVFHYLPSVDELNGIPESNLTMFRSRDNGPPYAPVFGTLNMTNHTVTRADLPSFTRFTLTLGDKANPLPVTLTAFDAKRSGTDALLTWQTASEQNSKGFDVQVSTDGQEFHTIGFVASASPNSTSVRNYSYLDTEKNKVGQRYYRLRQVDLDGKEAFLGPRVVSFDGKASEVAMVAYPNPFSGAEQLHLTLQSSMAGTGSVRITDMTGRTVREQKVDLNNGSNDVTVSRLSDLKAGVYLVRFALPSGQTQNLKVVKQ